LCIGLRLDDFQRLTPDEYSSVVSRWNDTRDSDNRDRWERMRLLAAICIQPHLKHRVTPDKLLPLPWDKGFAGRGSKEANNAAAINALAAYVGGKKAKEQKSQKPLSGSD